MTLQHPTSDEWHQDALKQSPTHAETADLVAQYIEWEAFAFWARLIAEREPELPNEVVGVIEQRCHGFLAGLHTKEPGRIEYSTWLRRRLLAWIEIHILADGARASSLDAVPDAARAHLRGERIAEYWADCSSRWRKSPPAPYPSFEQWLRDADAYSAQ